MDSKQTRVTRKSDFHWRIVLASLPLMEDVKVNQAVIPRPRAPAHEGALDSFHMRKGSEEPTEFGYFVLRKMADHDPPLSQAELGRRTGVGQSTISRWIFSPGRPNTEKLKLLASALNIDYNGLLTIAGYGQPSEDIAEALSGLRSDVDPLAEELSSMLDERSPLTDGDRAFLRNTVDRIIDPYRRTMRRR
jgi:transcriptional regulator with XRE-family HTH domain